MTVALDPLRAELPTLNVQPVIPISVNAQWNLILRTIVPIIGAQPTSPTAPQILLPDIGSDPIIVKSPQEGNTWGLGDTVQSFFLSPKAPTSNGNIWGAGPVFLYPTATSDILSPSLGRWTDSSGLKTARAMDLRRPGQPYLVVCGNQQSRA